MTARGRTLVLLLAALTLAGTGGRAEPPASEPEPPPAGAGPTAPPDGVAPPAPDAEATERAPEPAAAESEGPDHVAIDALAPDHVAYTTRAQPVLCWYLSAPTTTRIEITLIDDRSVEPLLDVVARPGIGAGVQRLSLSSGFVRNTRQVVFGGRGQQRRDQEDVQIPLDVSVTWRGSVVTAYRGSFRAGESNDPTGDTEREGEQHQLSLSSAFLPPGRSGSRSSSATPRIGTAGRPRPGRNASPSSTSSAGASR